LIGAADVRAILHLRDVCCLGEIYRLCNRNLIVRLRSFSRTPRSTCSESHEHVGCRQHEHITELRMSSCSIARRISCDCSNCSVNGARRTSSIGGTARVCVVGALLSYRGITSGFSGEMVFGAIALLSTLYRSVWTRLRTFRVDLGRIEKHHHGTRRAHFIRQSVKRPFGRPIRDSVRDMPLAGRSSSPRISLISELFRPAG
jgi:hypothetical protein